MGEAGGGGALLFEACCQCGMPKIGNADNSQAWRAITQMLGCNITAVDGQCGGTSQMDLGLSSSCLSPCCPTIWKQSHSPFRTRNRFSLGATYS